MGKKVNKAFDKLMPESAKKSLDKLMPESVKGAAATLGPAGGALMGAFPGAGLNMFASGATAQDSLNKQAKKQAMLEEQEQKEKEELGNKLDNSNRKLKKLGLFGGDNVAIGSARPQFKPFKNLLGE